MKNTVVELAALVIGIVLLSVGLSAWLGWPVAATVDGALLFGVGCWSAATGLTEEKG